MDIVLNDKEVRVLGSLIEKELSTPDYYPLSINALTNACNQKSSRDPVVSYGEHTVEGIVDDLAQKTWSIKASSAGSRKSRSALLKRKIWSRGNPQSFAYCCFAGRRPAARSRAAPRGYAASKAWMRFMKPWAVSKNTALPGASRASPVTRNHATSTFFAVNRKPVKKKRRLMAEMASRRNPSVSTKWKKTSERYEMIWRS